MNKYSTSNDPVKGILRNQDIATEQAVIGVLMIGDAPDAKLVTECLSADAFTVPLHRDIFTAAVSLVKDGLTTDPITIRHQLTKMGKEAFTNEWAADVLQRQFLCPNVADYCQTLLDLQYRRQAARLATELQQAAADGQDIGPILARAATLQRKLVATQEPDYVPLTELLDDFKGLREPIIEGLLRRGEIMNVIGVPKMRKSWFTVHLTLAVASGLQWLAFPTRKSRVLLIDNELHKETITYRAGRLLNAMNLMRDDVAGQYAVRSMRGRLADIYQMEDYFRRIGPGRFDLVVIDAWYRMQPRGEEENSNAAVAAAYNQLDKYAAMIDAAFIVVHHTTKGSQYEKSVTDMGSGAGAQSRAADTHMVLREHSEKDCVTLQAVVRSWEPVEAVALRWGFPLWNTASDLDPFDFKGARKKRDDKPAKDPWTAERFVTEIFGDERVPKPWVLAKAAKAGLSGRATERLLAEAEAGGLIVRERDVIGKVFYRVNTPF